MKKSKSDKIDDWLLTPPIKGDPIKVFKPGDKLRTGATIEKDNGDGTYAIIISEGFYGDERMKIPLAWIKKDPYRVGVDPFYPEIGRVTFSNYSIDGILGWFVDMREGTLRKDKRGHKQQGVEIIEFNFNPYIIDIEGKIVHFQRPLVWTLKEKQLLIESIYMNMDIGKVIVRKKSWKQIKDDVDRGEVPSFRDVVDGKQRLSTLTSFVLGEFPDMNGNYWNDLSDPAQRKIMNYQGLSYGEMAEDSTDAQVIATFLRVNFAGVPQSEEHIQFVKSINIK